MKYSTKETILSACELWKVKYCNVTAAWEYVSNLKDGMYL